jgi:hypothetical protein
MYIFSENTTKLISAIENTNGMKFFTHSSHLFTLTP